MNSKIFLVLCLLPLLNCQILTFDKEILTKIFQEHKIYLVYVHGDNHHFQVESIFNSHCFGNKQCAILDPQSQDYHQLRQYIGYQPDEFFLILDPLTKRKFVKAIPQGQFTDNELLSFEHDFQYKKLEPFFASEPTPAQNNQECWKLVGKNVGQFLRRQQRVKVILLFNLNKHCTGCDETLKQFIAFAERHFDEKVIAFGYFNTVLNDNPLIQDEKFPSFLIFIDQQHQSPFQLDAVAFDVLPYFLKKTLGQSFEAESEASAGNSYEAKAEEL